MSNLGPYQFSTFKKMKENSWQRSTEGNSLVFVAQRDGAVGFTSSIHPRASQKVHLPIREHTPYSEHLQG